MKPGEICRPTVNHGVLGENVGIDAPSVTFSPSQPAHEKMSLSTSIGPGSKGNKRSRVDLRPHNEQSLNWGARDFGTFQLESSPMEDSKSQQDGSSLPTCFGKKSAAYPKYSANVVGSGNADRAGCLLPVEPFDICLPESRKSYVLEPSGRERKENSFEKTGKILRSGMVLLKNYITLSEQAEVVKICRALGLGPGGFYQPGYQDGAKLRLHMMCLGRNWDPQTKKYEEQRRSDGSEPPGIPRELVSLVKKALQESHALIKQQDGTRNVEDILPWMSPDICIVNFYKTSGRLGLHKAFSSAFAYMRFKFGLNMYKSNLFSEHRIVMKVEKASVEDYR